MANELAASPNTIKLPDKMPGSTCGNTMRRSVVKGVDCSDSAPLTTEAVTLTSIRTVVVTRMVANPTKGVAPPAEAVLTIGWGGVGRVDLEPAGCSDPSCEADHGYTGTMTTDDLSLRVSEAADGRDVVAELLAFARALSTAVGVGS